MALLPLLRWSQYVWYLCLVSLFTLLAGLSGYSGEIYTKLLDNLTNIQELRTQAFLQPGPGLTVLEVEALARQLRLAGRDSEANVSMTLLEQGAAHFEAEDSVLQAHVRIETISQGGHAVLLPGVGSWWGLLIFFPQAGCYQVKVRAQNSQPAPIEIGISIGSIYEGVEPLRFDLGDHSWSDKSSILWAEQGRTTFEMIFLNDYYDQETGTDRNASVDWIEIAYVSENRCVPK